MVNNITYLFGAGASYNAIPLVNTFSKKLNKFRNWINKSPTKASEAKDNFIRDLTMVYAGCRNHYSIDTFAKKLFITQQYEDLKRVKRILDAFLLYFILIKKQL
jgi:hypothetical protein